MNILFLIGNGFDINIGLKTSFRDVLNEYLKIDTENDHIKQFQKEIDKNFENWSDFEKEMGKYTKEFAPTNKNDYFYQIDDFRKFLIQQFKLEEERIKYTNKDNIISVLKESLIHFNKNLTSTNSRIISSIINSGTGGNKNIYYNFVTFNYTNIFDKCLDTISLNKGILYSCATSDGRYTTNHIIQRILHIHGTLEKELILGVDNANQILNDDLAKDADFKWRITKPIMNKELGNGNEDDAKKLIMAATIIYTFGTSIGETDKTWWQCIYKWLNENATHRLIIFYYDEKPDRTNSIKKIEKMKDTKKNFLSLVGVSDDKKGQYEDRIFVAPQNDMFKMDIVSSSEESDFLETPQ